VVDGNVGGLRELVIEGAVGRLEGTEIEARPLGPFPACLAREVDVDVRRVGDRDVLEANDPRATEVDQADRPPPVVNGVDEVELA